MRALFAIIRNDFIICTHFRFDPIYAHGSSGILGPDTLLYRISQCSRFCHHENSMESAKTWPPALKLWKCSRRFMSRDRSFQFPPRPSELFGNVVTEYGSQKEAVAGKRHLRWATSKSLREASKGAS